jgi:formylglycine-generating enzyme required for sulfatase activity
MSQINSRDIIKFVAPTTDLTRAFCPMRAEQAAEVQQAAAESLGLPVYDELDCGDGDQMKLVLIPAGEFLMGSADDEDDSIARYEKPRHRVTITRPFYMGVYPVTQSQYNFVAGIDSGCQWDTDPAKSKSWFDAEEFCGELSIRTGRQVHLPTEAQWEYGCRAGTDTRFIFGNADAMLGRYAWHGGNRGTGAHPVGQKKPNAWHLHDMVGNVLEWCLDWWVKSYDNAGGVDPQGPDFGECRVCRGGGGHTGSALYRSANRLWRYAPDTRSPLVGFRVVVDLD